MRILLAALFSAALICLTHSPAHINNSTQGTKVQAVQAVAPEKATVVQSTAPTEPQPVEPEKLSPHQNLMQQAGIPRSEWSATDYIVTHESSWRPTVVNPDSGSCGLAQALPCSKMATHGGDYKHNPVTQLRWMKDYVTQRYGSFSNAAAFWQQNSWY